VSSPAVKLEDDVKKKVILLQGKNMSDYQVQL
jgi:hypothetical protein